jgi:hypothetical protein
VSASAPPTSSAFAKRSAPTASAASAWPTKNSEPDAAALAVNHSRPALRARAVPEHVQPNRLTESSSVIGGENSSPCERGRPPRSKFLWRVQRGRGADMGSDASARPEVFESGEAGQACPQTRLRAHRKHGRALALGRTSHTTRRICGRPDLTPENEVRDIGFVCDGPLTTYV